MNTVNAPIRPALLAAKIGMAINFELPEFQQELEEHPRFAEMLWTLQWVSSPENYVGGLRRFVHDMLTECADLIETPNPEDIGDWDDPHFWNTLDEHHATHKKLPTLEEARKEMLLLLSEDLPQFLRDLCEQPGVRLRTRRRYLPANIEEVILTFIDLRAGALSRELAETEVTQLVFRWIRKARSTGRAVKIIGNSRFGKTEAVRLFSRMHPGLARLVNTPASNTEGELLREVARALGIQEPRGRLFELRASVDEVLRRFRPVLIFDESQFLFPVQFNRNSQPARLNWYRRSVVDIGVPSVLIETPQSNKMRNKFVRTTGFAIEQVDERILKTVQLPEELPEEDLLAVARIHFPDLDERYQKYVVTVTLAAERNFLSDLEKIATLARDHASEAGRSLPRLDDIKAAIADVLPPAREDSKAAARAASAPDQQRSSAGVTTRAASPVLTQRGGAATNRIDSLTATHHG